LLSKLRKPRTNYNILGYTFLCFHECHEYKWGVCPHCRSRNKCKDHIRPVYPSEEGIYYPIERIEISPKHAEDLGTYIHEFTEHAIIHIFLHWGKDWNHGVKFEGYKSTYIVHFITPWGVPNGRSLFPATRKNRPKW
jgi:hypothetical protein